MYLQRVLGLAILVVGIFLLVFGINSTNKVSERVSQDFSGKYTNNTMWYIIGGSALIIIGGGMSTMRRRF